MSTGTRLNPVALLRPLLVALGVVVVLIEEVLWKALGRLMAWLGRLPLVARAEEFIRRLPPYPAMALFLLPIAVILPFKFAALWLMAKGRFLTGLAVLLAAKVSGMAVWARLYALCRPSLLTLGWFAKLEATLLRWRAWAHEILDRIEAYQRARQMVRNAVAAVRNWVGETPS